MAFLSKLWRRRRGRVGKPLPRLPPELWLLVFRIAAHDEFAHDHLDAPVSFLDVSSTNSDLLRRLAVYRLSLATRAALSRVCRTWHAITHQLLYEFVWVSSARQAHALAATLSSNHTLGITIRRLHIETPILERCDPADLRTIIDHAPRLAAYSDYRSILRQPYSSPDHLLSSLARPGNQLQRLCWTNYDYDTRDQSGCMSFFLRLSPALGMTASCLDYLELSLCATDLVSPNFAILPNAAVSIATRVQLPALRTLKLTLDDFTFSVLSQWDMPALRNLSVLSTDFSYTGHGFATFFDVHGHNIIQLELGHSTGAIEEHYLTTPRSNTTHPSSSPSLHLAQRCPNLREFICSADAEWNWQSPNWIAPHMLLPSHPNLQLIGIRDMNKRLLDDLDLYLSRHSHRFVLLPSHHRGPFFRLTEQLQSLLSSRAFPQLHTIRDMSWQSALMRRVQKMPVPGDWIVGWDDLERSTRSDERQFGIALATFWKTVKENCDSTDVVIQDWHGQPITLP